MLPHIIESPIAEAEASVAILRDKANNCTPEQSALRTCLLLCAQATENVCSVARQLGLAAIINRDTIVNRSAS